MQLYGIKIAQAVAENKKRRKKTENVLRVLEMKRIMYDANTVKKNLCPIKQQREP